MDDMMKLHKKAWKDLRPYIAQASHYPKKYEDPFSGNHCNLFGVDKHAYPNSSSKDTKKRYTHIRKLIRKIEEDTQTTSQADRDK